MFKGMDLSLRTVARPYGQFWVPPYPDLLSTGARSPPSGSVGTRRKPGSAPKIVIQGWYGNGNLGDEIILESMLTELRGHFPNASFVVISDNPEDTMRRHGVESLRRGGGRIQRFRRLHALTDADLFILGGGELLKPYGSSEVSVLTWLGPLELAHEMGVPTMTWAVGVSKALSPRAKALTKEVLSKTDAVTVRDQHSLEVLHELGVRKAQLTADPAFLFPGLHPGRRGHVNPHRTKVSVFVTKWYVNRSVISDPELWGRFERGVADCLDGLIETYGTEVRFIPMMVGEIDEDDRGVAREIAALTRNRDSIELFENAVSPKELLKLISESNLVIGMRLHSLILSAALKVPSLAIEYQSKVRRFSISMGVADWVVEISDSSAASIQELCRKALHGGYPLSQLDERLPALQALARKTTQIAAGLITQSESRGNRISRTLKGSSEVARRALGRKGWQRLPEGAFQSGAPEHRTPIGAATEESAQNTRVEQA